MEPEMPDQEVENILDLEAIQNSLRLISTSMPFKLLKSSARIVTLVLVNRKGALPLMLRLPRACRKIMKLDQHLEGLLRIPSVMKIVSASRDRIELDGRKDFTEFVKVLIDHIKETEMDIFLVYNVRKDYPTFDYQAHQDGKFFLQRAQILECLEKLKFNPDAHLLGQHIEMMRSTLMDYHYISQLGLPRCPFCRPWNRFQQQEHLFFAFVQIIADFIMKFEQMNFRLSIDCEAFLRCIALIKGPQNFRNWKCIQKIVASFRGGKGKYLKEYKEYNTLCQSQFKEILETEVEEKNGQLGRILPENSQ